QVGSSERAPQALETAAAHDDDVESDHQAGAVRPHREPGLGCAPHATHLLGGHHLERVTEGIAALRLDLAEDDHVAATRYDVELVARDPRVRIEDAIGP